MTAMKKLMTESSPEEPEPRNLVSRRRSDVPFFVVMGGLSSFFILLIVM